MKDTKKQKKKKWLVWCQLIKHCLFISLLVCSREA